MKKILICGSRAKGYDKIVRMVLDKIDKPFDIIHGRCLDSADQYADEWAKVNDTTVHHYPGDKGTYLKRNKTMVELCDECIAFWDGYSYGTAHTIAWCKAIGKPVRVVMLK